MWERGVFQRGNAAMLSTKDQIAILSPLIPLSFDFDNGSLLLHAQLDEVLQFIREYQEWCKGEDDER